MYQLSPYTKQQTSDEVTPTEWPFNKNKIHIQHLYAILLGIYIFTNS